MRARYYNPSIGRFTTVDPIRADRNYYSYCNNDPINRIDPSGLKSILMYYTGIMQNDGYANHQEVINAIKKQMSHVFDIARTGEKIKAYRRHPYIGKDVIEDAKDVIAYGLGKREKEIKKYVNEIKKIATKKKDKIYLVGFSGGGVVASLVGESLIKTSYKVKNIITIGSPNLWVNKKTRNVLTRFAATAYYQHGWPFDEVLEKYTDPSARLNLTRKVGNKEKKGITPYKEIEGLHQFSNLSMIENLHYGYWQPEEINGISNLTITVRAIVNEMKQ